MVLLSPLPALATVVLVVAVGFEDAIDGSDGLDGLDGLLTSLGKSPVLGGFVKPLLLDPTFMPAGLGWVGGAAMPTADVEVAAGWSVGLFR